jgi:hypothetical protein
VNGRKVFALGRLKQGERNRLEAAYERTLEARKIAGDIAWFAFEGLKLRLADKTFLTVDFFVMLASGELQAHECKGYMEGDAAVKLKVAAEMYPLRFFLVKARLVRDGGGFSVTEVGRE